MGFAGQSTLGAGTAAVKDEARYLGPGMPPRSHVSRNAAWNLAGLSIPLVIGLAAIPYTAHRLGEARFGLLGLVWAFLSYFNVFDFAVGRATTRFVAANMAGDRTRITDLVSLSLLLQGAAGMLGALALAALVPILTGQVLHLAPSLAGEARAAFYWTACALPFVLLGSGLRSVLEAVQRFDLAAAVRAPGSAATFLLPGLGAALGWDLGTIALLLFLARVAACGGFWIALRRALPGVTWRWPEDWSPLKPLLSFGGWVSVSNVVSPVLVYGDRFVLAALAGPAAAGYYTAPFEAANRLLIVPGSYAAALYPAVSAVPEGQGGTEPRRMLRTTLRHLAVLLTVPVLLLLLFAPGLLRVWLGADFAQQAGLALRFLVLGIAANAVGQVCYAALQGAGRPDLTAKFHLLELPVYGVLAWILVGRYGIPGAAAAWALRMLLDTTLLYGAARRVLGR